MFRLACTFRTISSRAVMLVAMVALAACDRPVEPDPIPVGKVERSIALAPPVDIIVNNDIINPDIVTDVSGCSRIDCDDGNPCNGAESCNSKGACVPGTVAGKGTSCSDGDMCNGDEQCDGAGACVAGQRLVCNDNKPCTSDTCVSATGCKYTNIGAGTSCSDGNMCNGAETCDGAGTCAAGAALNCNDGNPCTDDACVPATGCSRTNNTAACEDGNACTYGERCAAGSCGGGLLVDCKDDQCNVRKCNGTATCDSTPKVAACDDGVACSYSDACDAAGRCVGKAIMCNSDAQTLRSCNGTDKCTEMPRPGAPCDDGNPCTKDDAQLADGRCVGTVYACAVSACLSANRCDGKGGCVPTPKSDGTGCDADGSKCTPSDVCKAGVCVADPSPVACVPRDCNTAACDPATGNCKYTPTSGGACGVTGCFTQGMCNNGQCSGTPKDCSAFDSACSTGVCNSETGKCLSMSKPNGTSCQTAAKCAVGAACFFGRCELAPMVCPAAMGPCKMPTCDETSGMCSEKLRPAGSTCDSGNPCVLNATCTADGSCVGAPAPNGDPCTFAEGVAGVCALGRCQRVEDPMPSTPDAGVKPMTTVDAGADAPAGTGGPGSPPPPGKGGGGGCTIGGQATAPGLLAFVAAVALMVRRRRR